jgi:hypothetical protein
MGRFTHFRPAMVFLMKKTVIISLSRVHSAGFFAQTVYAHITKTVGSLPTHFNISLWISITTVAHVPQIS